MILLVLKCVVFEIVTRLRKCVLITAVCQKPEISNGKLSVEKDQYVTPENVTITCDPGYRMVGSQNIFCSENKSWSPDVPKCEKVSNSQWILCHMTPQNKLKGNGMVLKIEKEIICPKGLFQLWGGWIYKVSIGSFHLTVGHLRCVNKSLIDHISSLWYFLQ